MIIGKCKYHTPLSVFVFNNICISKFLHLKLSILYKESSLRKGSKNMKIGINRPKKYEKNRKFEKKMGKNRNFWHFEYLNENYNFFTT